MPFELGFSRGLEHTVTRSRREHAASLLAYHCSLLSSPYERLSSHRCVVDALAKGSHHQKLQTIGHCLGAPAVAEWMREAEAANSVTQVSTKIELTIRLVEESKQTFLCFRSTRA